MGLETLEIKNYLRIARFSIYFAELLTCFGARAPAISEICSCPLHCSCACILIFNNNNNNIDLLAL